MSPLRGLVIERMDLQEETCKVDEWGVEFLLRGLSAGDIDEVKRHGGTDLAAGVLAIINGVYDPDTRDRVFGPTDRDILLKKNAGVIDRLGAKILQLSGATRAAQGEAEKNSETAG